jgi:hypothetical protein
MLPSGQKLTLDLLVTITLEVVPFHAYALFPALLSFLNAPGSRVLWGCSAPPAILPQSPELYPNCSLSILSSVGGNREKLGGWGMTVILFLVKKHKESARPPSCGKFHTLIHRLPRYTSTIIYHCITLLQLLWRWQHQSQKLWIPKVQYVNL